MFLHKFQAKLNERIEKGSLRSLLCLEDKVDFWSNDYLGLGKNEHLISLKSGSGSRLISGNSSVIERVEKEVADYFEAESALIFNSGYDANLGFFSSLPQKGDVILYDELVHASVRDGIRLSFATSYSFQHNDCVDLEKRLNKVRSISQEGTVFVAIESLYSMDGDIAPLKEIALICEKFNALLIVDEAHAGAVFGKEGRGLCEKATIVSKTFARLFTFGKGFGTHGAAIVCSQEVRTFLVNFSRSFIYTTALPEAFYSHIYSQISQAKDEDLRIKLHQNIAFFRKRIKNYISAENSPIQMIEFSDLSECKAKEKQLIEAGFAVKAILPPTVSEGKQRIRVCIHAFNSEEEIERLVEVLNELV